MKELVGTFFNYLNKEYNLYFPKENKVLNYLVNNMYKPRNSWMCNFNIGLANKIFESFHNFQSDFNMRTENY